MEIPDIIKNALGIIGFLVFFLWVFKRQRKGIEQDHHTEEQKNVTLSTDDKLEYICNTLNHIRWIGLSIAIMFALTYLMPQCTG